MKAYFQEIPYDQFTQVAGDCILEFDRYSFVGMDPIASISGQGDYSEALRKLRREFPVEADHPLALFTGAPIGYITFENEYFFQIYQSAIIFDHQEKRAVISSFGSENLLSSPPEANIEISEIEVDKSDEEYAEMVERAKEYLREGEVYQIVLSRQFQAKINVDPLQFYNALRKTRPAPYLFFFQLYRNNLKNREFGKEAPQNLHAERATIAQGQGASEHANFEEKPTPPKTNSSDYFGSLLKLAAHGEEDFLPFPIMSIFSDKRNTPADNNRRSIADVKPNSNTS